MEGQWGIVPFRGLCEDNKLHFKELGMRTSGREGRLAGVEHSVQMCSIRISSDMQQRQETRRKGLKRTGKNMRRNYITEWREELQLTLWKH